MANEVRIVVSGDSKDAEAALKRAGGAVDDFAKKARGIGLAMTAVGAAGAFMLTKAVTAAIS